MANGQRASMLANAAGKDFYKKRGFMSRCAGWMSGVSHKSGTNKLTKRYTNKSYRQQVRRYIKKEIEYDE